MNAFEKAQLDFDEMKKALTPPEYNSYEELVTRIASDRLEPATIASLICFIFEKGFYSGWITAADVLNGTVENSDGVKTLHVV